MVLVANGILHNDVVYPEKKLEEYLSDTIPGFEGSLSVKEFKGGQSNPTYQLITPNKKYVLRRKPPGKLLPSAHAVDREYRVITALNSVNYAVPETFCLCEDESIICLLYTSPSPRDRQKSRMPSSA